MFKLPEMWDAANPPRTSPKGYQAAAGYIGGDTPHVWTVEEWERLGRLPKLPIYVRSNDGTDPHEDAFQTLKRLYQIGCPPGSRIALDMETRVNANYVATFYRRVRFFGYRLWVYGSAVSVFRNPACNGYWVADFADRGPFMYKDKRVRATQYQPGSTFDSSTLRRFQLHRMWR